MTIAILGIGGVGGYFGGLLAERYHGADDVRVIFITKPATGEIIRRDGLRIITDDGERTVHPAAVVSDTEELAPLDVLICATKSYDLVAALAPLASSLSERTLILPLLNGVDAGDRIRALHPDAITLDGCVNVNAQRTAPGVIRKSGAIEKLFFGSPDAPAERLAALHRIFLDAGIDAHLSDDIASDIWTKFLLNAGMASATSHFDETIGALLADPAHRAVLTSLVGEAHRIAVAKGIVLPDDIVARTIEKMEALPYDGTSSMHRDYRSGGPTEYRSLSKYVADAGDALGIDTPTFDAIIPDLARRAG